jgi:hypothetical protein
MIPMIQQVLRRTLSNRAEKNLRRVPAADRARLLAAMDAMGADPLVGDVVKQ